MAGSIWSAGAVNWVYAYGGSVTATVDAATNVGIVYGEQAVTGDINAGGSVNRVYALGGPMSAKIDAGRHVGIVLSRQEVTGDITAKGSVNHVQGASIQSAIRAEGANTVGLVRATAGDVAGSVWSAGGINAVYAFGGNITAAIEAGTYVGTLYAKRVWSNGAWTGGDVGADGANAQVKAGTDVRRVVAQNVYAAIDAGQDVRALTSYGVLQGLVKAARNVLSLRAFGAASAVVEATAGYINSLYAAGAWTGDVTAKSINRLQANSIDADLTTTGTNTIGLVYARKGSIEGTIDSKGGIGTIQAIGGGVSAAVMAAIYLSKLYTTGNLTGGVETGSGRSTYINAASIRCAVDIGGAIRLFTRDDLSGSADNALGSIVAVAGGLIYYCGGRYTCAPGERRYTVLPA